MKIELKNFNLSLFLIYIFPILLITGPALPDIAMVLVSLFFLFYIIKNNEYYILKQSWFLLGLLLWFWFIFVSIFAYNKSLAFADAIIFIRFLLFILAIQFYIIKTDKIRGNIIKLLFIFSIVILIDCLYQFFNYDNEIGFMGDIIGIKPEGLYGRLSGPFKDLVPGSILTKFFFISLIFIITTNKNMFFSLTILSLIILTVFLSGERMAWATLVMGITITIIFLTKTRVLLLSSLIISVILILIINNLHPMYKNISVIESSSYHEGLIIEKEFPCKNNTNIKCKKIIKMQPKFLTILRDFGNSAYGEIYNLSFYMWKENKFMGIGLNNFKYICQNDSNIKNRLKYIDCPTHPHNFYIQALVETGIVGFLLFSLLILSFLITIYKSDQKKIYKVLFIVSLITVFWPIMSTGSFLKNWHMAAVCYLIGICLSNPKQKNY